MKAYNMERVSQLPPPMIVLLGSTRNLPPAISLVDIGRNAWRCTDSTGIPLSSDRADPKLTANIDWDYQPFRLPESPSRFFSTKLFSGLEKRRFLEHHLAIFAIINLFREMYIRQVLRTPQQPEADLTLREAEALHKALIYLPHYLTHRIQDTIPNQGVLPPSVIILSNGAGGALGAMNSYVVDHEEDQGEGVFDTSPAGRLLVQNAEGHESMIGDRTVCPIAPRQQGAFIEEILKGVNMSVHPNRNVDEVLEWVGEHFHPGEIANLTLFGEQLYEAQGKIDGPMRGYDKEGYLRINPFRRGNPRRYRNVLEDFLQKTGWILADLNTQQKGINLALGRTSEAKPLTLGSFEGQPTDLKMPALLREIQSRYPRDMSAILHQVKMLMGE